GDEISLFFEIGFALGLQSCMRAIFLHRVLSKSWFIEFADSDHPKRHDLLACFAVACAGTIRELVQFIESIVNRLKVLLRQLRDPGRKKNVQFMDLLAVSHIETTDDLRFALFESSRAETRRGARDQSAENLTDAFDI